MKLEWEFWLGIVLGAISGIIIVELIWRILLT